MNMVMHMDGWNWDIGVDFVRRFLLVARVWRMSWWEGRADSKCKDMERELSRVETGACEASC